MNIEIRPACASDCLLIADYNCRLASETEGKRLDEHIVRCGVAALLEHAERGRYLIAEVAGAAVGQLLITYEWSDWRNGMFWWLQSVYIDARHRRRGVFAALLRHVVALARESGEVCGLRLYVEAENEVAARTYRALGLATTSYELMELELPRAPGDAA